MSHEHPLAPRVAEQPPAMTSATDIVNTEASCASHESELAVSKSEPEPILDPAVDGPVPEPILDPDVDGPVAWCICAATFVVFFITLGQIYAFAVLYNAIIDDLKTSEGLTAVMFGVATGIMNGFGVFSGMLINTLGYKRVAMIGGLVLALGNLGSSFSQDVTQLIICYGVLVGTGTYLNMAAALPMVNLWFVKKRSLAAGVSMAGSGVGMMVLSPLLQLVVDEYGWRTGFRAFACLSLSTSVVGSIVYKVPSHIQSQTAAPITEQQRKQQPDEVIANPINQSTQQEPAFHKTDSVGMCSKDQLAISISIPLESKPQAAVREPPPLFDLELFKDPVYRTLAFSFFLVSLGYFVPFAFAVKLAEDKGFSGSQGSMLLTIMGVANTAGRLVAGRVGDLVDRRQLFAMCMWFGGGALMPLGFDLPYWLLALLLATFSIFGGAFVAMFPVLVTDSFGAKRVSSTIGMLMATVAPGALVGSPLVGFVYSSMDNDYRLAFMLTGFFLIAGGCVSLIVKVFLEHPEHIDCICESIDTP